MKEKQQLTDLRATAPAALEDGSDTAWAQFQALQNADPDQFAATRPSTMPGPLPHPDGQAEAQGPGSTARLEDALAIARASNRVCPMPQPWAKLVQLLQEIAPPGSVPPFAIDGQAWSIVPPMQKRMRLRDQLEWADRFGVLDAALKFLQSLPEKAWLHF